MKRQQLYWTGVALAAALASGTPSWAEKCGILALGGSTRFSQPVESIGDLRSMFTRHWSVISDLLARAGWAGDPDDLRDTVARGRVTTQHFVPGTRIEWMMLRTNQGPTLARNDCWGGKEAFEAFVFEVESNGRRWFFSVPKICGNLALMGSEPLAGARAEPEPPPAYVAAAPPPPAEESTLYVAPSPPWSAEIFAGYFFPEELDEDLTFGARFGYRTAWDWGWMLAVSWFDVADSQGFSGRLVDADVVHVDLSAVWYPIDGGRFSIFFGPGWASGNIDVPNTTRDFSDDAFTLHAGMGYEFDFSPHFYIKPDVRLRWYELEGFGPNGGRQTQLTYEAAFALGWRFGD